MSVSNGVPASSSSNPRHGDLACESRLSRYRRLDVVHQRGHRIPQRHSAVAGAGGRGDRGRRSERPRADAGQAAQHRGRHEGDPRRTADCALRRACTTSGTRICRARSTPRSALRRSRISAMPKTQGIDIDVTWYTPIDGLNVSLIGNVNKASSRTSCRRLRGANPRKANGTRLFNTPPHNWRVDVGYDRDVGAAGWAAVRERLGIHGRRRAQCRMRRST